MDGSSLRIIFQMKGLSKESVTQVEVAPDFEGQRIDNFLIRHAKGVPKSHVYRILRTGQVRVNGSRMAPDGRLRAGDLVRIPPLRVAQPEEKTVPGRQFPVIFEDEQMLVVNKPAGVAVHGGSGVSFGVIEQLRAARPELRMLELAHRLDRDTSGLLVIAKKRSSLKRLHEAFREGKVEKRYLALVKGRWRNALQNVRLPLHKYTNADGERRVRVAEEGQEAHSIMRLVSRHYLQGQIYSLLEVELKTGRTHQIRVHLSHLGFPIVGDEKYGDFPLNKALQKSGSRRMFLHARSLNLPDGEGRRLALAAPLAEDLQIFLDRLEPEASS